MCHSMDRRGPWLASTLTDFAGTLAVKRGCVVGHHGNFSGSTKRFVEACVNVGIPYTADFNTPKGTLGISSVRHFTLHVKDLPLHAYRRVGLFDPGPAIADSAMPTDLQ